MSNVLKFIKDLKQKADGYMDEQDEKFDNRLADTYGPEMDREEALDKAKQVRQMGSSGGMTMGSIGKVLKSPASKVMDRARQGMTKHDPARQKKLAEELSSVVEEPLKLRTGEVLYPRHILESFKRNIK